MKISFLGYGNMAAALGARWAGRHDLFVGGRDAAKAKALAEKFGHGARSGSEAEAAEFGEVVVLATPPMKYHPLGDYDESYRLRSGIES